MNIGDFTHDADAHRFVLDVDDYKAFVDYRLEDGVYHLTYTEVPSALRGGGVGKTLVEKTFEAIAADDKKKLSRIVPISNTLRNALTAGLILISDRLSTRYRQACNAL